MKGNVAVMSRLTALALVIPACFVFAAQKQEHGSFDAAYVKRDVQPIAEGHVLMLDEATGTNKGGGRFDGFSVSCREIVDLDNGNGSNNAYCLFAKGGDAQTIKVSGKIATEINDEHPNATLAGGWVVVSASGSLAGSKGEGSYAGYFTGEDRYHIDWKGWLEDWKESVPRRIAGSGQKMTAVWMLCYDPTLPIPVFALLRKGSLGARLQSHPLPGCGLATGLSSTDSWKVRAENLCSRAARR